MEELSSVFIYLSYSCLTIAVLIGAACFSKMSKPILFGWIFLMGQLFIEVFSGLFREYGINNLWLLHFSVLNEYVLLGLLYVSVLTKSNTKERKRMLFLYVLGLVALIILRLGSSLWPELDIDWHLYSNTIVHLFLVLFSGYYLYSSFTKPSENSNNSIFLINAGVFCLYSASYISDLIFNQLVTVSFIDVGLVWGANLVIVSLFYLLFGYSFIVHHKMSLR